MEIKSAVVGYGHATKEQVQMMVGSHCCRFGRDARRMPPMPWLRRSAIFIGRLLIPCRRRRGEKADAIRRDTSVR